MIDIEQVIENFDEYLDATNEPANICGFEFAPNEVLRAISLDLYTKKLNKYIDENYRTVDTGEGDLMYAPH